MSYINEKEKIIQSLLTVDFTKMPEQRGSMTTTDASKLADWIMERKNLELGTTFIQVRKPSHRFAVILTPHPKRADELLKQILFYRNLEDTLLIFMFQSESEIDYFQQDLLPLLRRSDFLASFYSGFGADISYKRELGTIYAIKYRVRYVIHHDTDVDLVCGVEEYLSEALRIFSQIKKVAVVSFPVKMLKGTELEHFKPKSREELFRIDEKEVDIASYGTGGCFLVHDISKTSEIYAHPGGMHFSWVRGLYGEWVPFSGLVRSLGYYACYSAKSHLFTINKEVRGTNLDVLFKKDIIAEDITKILVSGSQTLLEFGAGWDETLKYINSRGSECSHFDNNHLAMFAHIWSSEYMKKKVWDKQPKESEIIKAIRLTKQELERRYIFAHLQRSVLEKLTLNKNLLLIPPFAEINKERFQLDLLSSKDEDFIL